MSPEAFSYAINHQAAALEQRVYSYNDDQTARVILERLCQQVELLPGIEDSIDWLYDVSFDAIFTEQEVQIMLMPPEDTETIEPEPTEEDIQLAALKAERSSLAYEIDQAIHHSRSLPPGTETLTELRIFLRHHHLRYDEVDEYIQMIEMRMLREVGTRPAPPEKTEQRAGAMPSSNLSDSLTEAGLPKALWVPILSNVERLLRHYKQLLVSQED